MISLEELGLACGQKRENKDRICYQDGWYNESGQRLGWGDLDADDFRCVSLKLQAGELFLVLSFMNLYPVVADKECVKEHLTCLIAPKLKFYLIDEPGVFSNIRKLDFRGMVLRIIEKDEVATLLWGILPEGPLRWGLLRFGLCL